MVFLGRGNPSHINVQVGEMYGDPLYQAALGAIPPHGGAAYLGEDATVAG